MKKANAELRVSMIAALPLLIAVSLFAPRINEWATYDLPRAGVKEGLVSPVITNASVEGRDLMPNGILAVRAHFYKARDCKYNSMKWELGSRDRWTNMPLTAPDNRTLAAPTSKPPYQMYEQIWYFDVSEFQKLGISVNPVTAPMRLTAVHDCYGLWSAIWPPTVTTIVTDPLTDRR